MTITPDEEGNRELLRVRGEMTETVPAAAEIGELSTLAKALAHPARVRILQLLLSRDVCYCGQIVEELPLAQATVSQHLKVLRDAGLVVGEIDHPHTCYCAATGRLRELYDLIGDMLAEATEIDTDGCR